MYKERESTCGPFSLPRANPTGYLPQLESYYFIGILSFAPKGILQGHFSITRQTSYSKALKQPTAETLSIQIEQDALWHLPFHFTLSSIYLTCCSKGNILKSYTAWECSLYSDDTMLRLRFALMLLKGTCLTNFCCQGQFRGYDTFHHLFIKMFLPPWQEYNLKQMCFETGKCLQGLSFIKFMVCSIVINQDNCVTFLIFCHPV